VSNSNYLPTESLSGLEQKYIKANLAKAFVSKEIITAVEIDWHGRIEIKKQNWESYWNIKETLPERESFLHFEKAREAYFDSGFKLDLLSEYCYRYFVLLSKWLGLRVQNPARHFSKGTIRANLSYLDYQQMDYLNWIDKQSETLQSDIVLLCRLLNNLSLFDIESTDDEGKLWYIAGQQHSPEIIVNLKYNPVYCLNPQNYCPENLIHTNAKTRLSEDCSAYRVISLTDYYKAISTCMDTGTKSDCYYYPVRKFNHLSLLNSNGKSVIGKLSKIADLTVIEDVDLTANYLAKHIQEHNIDCVASAINIDDRYSSQVLAVCDKNTKTFCRDKRYA